ncbi:probable disease resistance protein At4g33300 [Cryptomeria japonica]|uniref:probable disease resistance protein At4g33300 n=1 Tax=Cryptomeria japonica TaxID=3369 RepID=UPI0025ABEC4F|nr:probable disease resistance protein At4g33300 [Cryptomeria japonica]
MASVHFVDNIEIEEDSACVITGDSQFYVGLEKCTGHLKGLLIQNEVSVVAVHSMAGGGKTTLARAVCNDNKIREYFDNNVIFITVSKSPNLKGIFGTIWKNLAGRKTQEFQNLEDEHMQMKKLISRHMKRTLVILDDVWSREDLEYLLFEGPGFKTLITSRDKSIIPSTLSTQVYQLPLLCHEDALPLFCFWAFGQTSIPSTANANMVKELLVECGGLPLALKVIGSSLYGKPHEAWETARESFSKGESISDYNKKGLIRLLEITVDSLDNVAKECFQDLSLFPEDRKICADALLDIWVYVRDLQWHNAFSILLDLASKNLLNLTSTSGSRRTISNRNTSELYFSQNNVIRELALRLECQGSVGHKKRLLLPRKEQSSSQKRELLNGTEFDVQLLSIHTGHMEENYWEEMNFPEAEALLLHFTSTECFLPPFLESMKNLKCLMVFNYSTKRGTLKGLDILSGLPHVKSVRLQRLIILPTQKESKSLPNIEKLSLSLCEGFEYTSTFNNVNLRDFRLDHCSHLEEVPLSFCYMPSAQMWSITNCHLIQKLPYDLGNLSSLKMLKLSALPSLKELPTSIGKLGQLESLDISFCEGLRELPKEIGQLKKLNEFDMRECSHLTRLPRVVCELNSLKLVICDEKVSKQWLRAKNISITELRIEIAEAHFSLEWLDD